MPEVEEDYSDFIGHLANASSIASLFAGFTLTVLFILITRFPDPSPILIQSVLFLLSFLFDLFTFLVSWLGNLDIRYIKDLPPYTKGMKACGFLESFGISAFGIVMVLVFIFFKLDGLALISLMTWSVFMIMSYFFTYKPTFEKRRMKSS